MPEMTYAEGTLLHVQNMRIVELEAKCDRLAAENERLEVRWLNLYGDHAAALTRIKELEAERDRLREWQEFVRYNSKEAAHAADEEMTRRDVLLHDALDEIQRITESDYSAADGGGDG